MSVSHCNVFIYCSTAHVFYFIMIVKIVAVQADSFKYSYIILRINCLCFPIFPTKFIYLFFLVFPLICTFRCVDWNCVLTSATSFAFRFVGIRRFGLDWLFPLFGRSSLLRSMLFLSERWVPFWYMRVRCRCFLLLKSNITTLDENWVIYTHV